MGAFVPFLTVFTQSPASISCLPSRDLFHNISLYLLARHGRGTLRISAAFLRLFVFTEPSDKNRPVSDLADEELFSFVSDGLKLTNAAQCLREKMPSLIWNGLITMVEDPKIIYRWEGMGKSYLEANNLKGAISSFLRLTYSSSSENNWPKKPGIELFFLNVRPCISLFHFSEKF